MKINLSIIGSSRIVEEHIKAALEHNFSVKYIFSSNKKSKNVRKLAIKYKIKKIDNFKNFIELSKKINSNYLIAGRIKDNHFYLQECLKTKKKILVEKPVFLKTKLFDKYIKFNKRIFVGYNRIFYKNLKVIDKILSKEKNISINCLCPEVSKERIITNSAHIISILLFLNKDLKLIYKEKIGNIIFIRFKGKNKSRININFHLKSLSNFKIEFVTENFFIEMCPIEYVRIFNKIKKVKKNNNNIYELKSVYEKNEYSISKIKPGFSMQMNYFKNFCRNKKVVNDLNFAKKLFQFVN